MPLSLSAPALADLGVRFLAGFFPTGVCSLPAWPSSLVALDSLSETVYEKAFRSLSAKHQPFYSGGIMKRILEVYLQSISHFIQVAMCS